MFSHQHCSSHQAVLLCLYSIRSPNCKTIGGSLQFRNAMSPNSYHVRQSLLISRAKRKYPRKYVLRQGYQPEFSPQTHHRADGPGCSHSVQSFFCVMQSLNVAFYGDGERKTLRRNITGEASLDISLQNEIPASGLIIGLFRIRISHRLVYALFHNVLGAFRLVTNFMSMNLDKNVVQKIIDLSLFNSHQLWLEQVVCSVSNTCDKLVVLYSRTQVKTTLVDQELGEERGTRVCDTAPSSNTEERCKQSLCLAHPPVGAFELHGKR